MNCGIYRITNVINSKVYIGSSKSLKKRKYNHFYYLKAGTSKNPHLQSAYNMYGKEAFHWMVIEYCTPELLEDREEYWMLHYDSRNPEKGYNIASVDRHEVSEETRAKMSASLRGNPKLRTWVGRTHSDETKRKMSAAQKGRTYSDETKAKMSAGQKARAPASEETRAKLSAALKGRISNRKGITMSEEQKAKISAALKKGQLKKEI